MIVVVTAAGKGPQDGIDERFGRAPYLVIHDSERGTFETHDNSEQVEAAQGAGVQTAMRVARLGAEVLLTSHCGPKAFDMLNAAGVEVYSCSAGTVAEAVEAWSAGRLDPLTSPDRKSGAGSR